MADSSLELSMNNFANLCIVYSVHCSISLNASKWVQSAQHHWARQFVAMLPNVVVSEFSLVFKILRNDYCRENGGEENDDSKKL